MSELRQKVRNNVAARAGCQTPCRMSVLDCACLNTTDAAIALIRNETLEEAAVVFSRYEDDPFAASTVADHLRKMKDKP